MSKNIRNQIFNLTEGSVGGGSWSAYWATRYISGLTVSLVISGVQLDWTSTGIIEIWVSTGGEPYILLFTTDEDCITFTDEITNLFPASYKVRIKKGDSYSAFSNIAIQSIDVDANNFFLRVVNAGETLTDEQKINFDTTIKALKAANLYYWFDALVISRQTGRASAKLNLINQYDAVTFGTKLTGSVGESTFYYICELTNKDLLIGSYLAPADGHYYRSTNDGETWIDQGALLAGETGIYCFCDFGSGIILAGTSINGHILRSTNNGYDWTDLGQQFSKSYIPLIINLSGGIGLATTELSPTPAVADILRTTDYGATWSNVGNASTDMTVINMICDLGGGIIIAGGGRDTGGGVFDHGRIIRSIDYGATWSDLGTLGATIGRCFGSVYLGDGVVIVGTDSTDAISGHIFRSTDYGATWTDMNVQFANALYSSFINCGSGKILGGYTTSTGSGGIVRSLDYGLSWEIINTFGASVKPNDLKLLSNGTVIISTTSTAAMIYKNTTALFSRKLSNSYDSTEVANGGTLTFTPDGGFNSDGIKSYLKSNFIPNASQKYQLNDACFGYKVSGSFVGSGYGVMMGSQNAAGNCINALFESFTGGTCAAYINAIVTAGGHITAIGYNCLSRFPDGTVKQLVNNNSYDITSAITLNVNDKEFYLLCYNEFPNPKYWIGSNARLEINWLGKGLTQSQFNTFRGIMDAHIAAH